MRIAIIGAGIAGLSCAGALRERGHELALFDKGSGPGGRMATHRIETAAGAISFDHGATHFTVRGDAFRTLAARWQAEGSAAPWPVAGRDAWVGTPTMDAPIRSLARRHHVQWDSPISGIVRNMDGWWCLSDRQTIGPFDAVVVALPAEPAAALLSPHDFQMARIALAVESRPCWTGMFAFEAPLADVPDIIRHQGPVCWAVRNNAKPGRGREEAWVVQANPHWSRHHAQDSGDAVARLLLSALREATGRPLPPVTIAAAYLWRYGQPSGRFEYALWNPLIALGACGDWLTHGYVELAWDSGRELARQIACEETRRGRAVDRPS